MSLSSYYQRQFAWRAWPTIFDALPPLGGQTVLDLGCGIGDQVAELVARGAHVVGFDMNEEVIVSAKSRGLVNAEFRVGDLRRLADLRLTADGIWSSFTAAYFPDFSPTLAAWARCLRPGGWIALTEIDDLFGHGPVTARTKSLFAAYAADALSAGRYDFHMGRKLASQIEQAGFAATDVFTVADRELSFAGPAAPEVVEAWRDRLDGMKLLQDFCGPDFPQLRDDFLTCLARDDHRCTAKVYCCVGTKRD